MTNRNKPFFTIIIPIYNRVDLIETAIQSVLNQTINDFEIICIDDGSIDGTIDILNSYSISDIRVKLIQHAINKGRSAARNTGISNANGKWICFLDSDDFYHANHLEHLLKLIKTYPENSVFATNQIIQNRKPSIRFLKNQITILTLSDFIYNNPITLNQLCYRNNQNILFEPEEINYSEDLLFIRKFLLDNVLIISPHATVTMPINLNRSMLQVSTSEFIQNNLISAKAFCDYCNNSKISKKVLGFTYLFCASIAASSTEKSIAKKLFLKGLKYKDNYFNFYLYKTFFKICIFSIFKK